MNHGVICDAQVHAPDRPVSERPLAHVGGLDRPDLEREMDAIGVDGAIIVPLVAEDNDRAFAYVRERPGRFAAMPVFRLAAEPHDVDLIVDWRARSEVVGMRATFFAPAARALLAEDALDWLWSAAEASNLPVIVNAPENVHRMDEVAERHPGLRLLLDHMGLTPFETYTEERLQDAVRPVIDLARHPNVGVKLTALPSSVDEGYPFRSLHEPVRRVIDAFGPSRTFWGSDLTRLPCTYADVLRLFTEGLPFLEDRDRSLILGDAICTWLGWWPSSR